MFLTDTHCHLNFQQFDADRTEVLERAWQAGIERILIPGTDLSSSRSALRLANSHPNLFAAIGIHPTEAVNNLSATLAEISALAHATKVKALGEIGLDYYWQAAPRHVQQETLERQLTLAATLNLPVVLHMREAQDAPDGECAWDLLAILEAWVNDLRAKHSPLAERPGVLHSFSGTAATAQKAIALNFYIGISGPVTYKNAEAKRQLVKALPLERILLETDAPYLAPVPKRGARNEPALIRHIADKIAEIYSKNAEEIAAHTSANAARLFAW